MMSKTGRDGIILLAKQAGLSSFSALWQVKKALGIKKVGHTGTLDSFADGLLVVLCGHMTHLVPYVTACSKEYTALVTFGKETDTLDPEGQIVRECTLPCLADIKKVIPSFCGDIQQQPPVYSAIHINGKRASERMRNGEVIEMAWRAVSIYSLDIVSALTEDGSKTDDELSRVASLFLHISCSKGTYIRSLARDIACAAGSCAYLSALRRTKIGPFMLENAAGFSHLPIFGSLSPTDADGSVRQELPSDEILSHVRVIDPETACMMGLPPAISIDERFRFCFLNGKPIKNDWFRQGMNQDGKFAVFCGNDFLGIIRKGKTVTSYECVCGGGQ